MKNKKYGQKWYQSLYNTKNWILIRNKHLLKQPFCFFCDSTHLLQVDHIFDHKGNLYLFNDSRNLQTLCVEHHTLKGALDKYCSDLESGEWVLILDFGKSYDLDSYNLLTNNRLRSLTKIFNEQETTLDKITLRLGSLDLSSQKHLVNLAMKKMKSRPFMVKYINNKDKWIEEMFNHYCLKEPRGVV